MITVLSALLGFIGSFAPDLIKMWQGRQDAKHELAILQLQLEAQAKGHLHRMEEINAYADIAESNAIHKPQKLTGIHWVDALNGTVRPVIAYAFFLLYATVKVWQFMMLPENPLPWHIASLWAIEDQAIFAAVISYYFGQRAMMKVREGK